MCNTRDVMYKNVREMKELYDEVCEALSGKNAAGTRDDKRSKAEAALKKMQDLLPAIILGTAFCRELQNPESKIPPEAADAVARRIFTDGADMPFAVNGRPVSTASLFQHGVELDDDMRPDTPLLPKEERNRIVTADAAGRGLKAEGVAPDHALYRMLWRPDVFTILVGLNMPDRLSGENCGRPAIREMLENWRDKLDPLQPKKKLKL